MIRVEVSDRLSADGLVNHLAGVFEPAAISLDADRGEVRVEGKRESAAVIARVLGVVDGWLAGAGVASATVWIDATRYTLPRRPPPIGHGESHVEDGARSLHEQQLRSTPAILRDPDTIGFGVDVDRRGEFDVVTLHGEVDLYAAPALDAAVRVAVDRGSHDLVVDLTEVTFIDSTFFGVLIGAYQRLEKAGGSIAVVCGDRKLMKLFEITGLDRVFPIHSTLATAIGSRERIA